MKAPKLSIAIHDSHYVVLMRQSLHSHVVPHQLKLSVGKGFD